MQHKESSLAYAQKKFTFHLVHNLAIKNGPLPQKSQAVFGSDQLSGMPHEGLASLSGNSWKLIRLSVHFKGHNIIDQGSSTLKKVGLDDSKYNAQSFWVEATTTAKAVGIADATGILE